MREVVQEHARPPDWRVTNGLAGVQRPTTWKPSTHIAIAPSAPGLVTASLYWRPGPSGASAVRSTILRSPSASSRGPKTAKLHCGWRRRRLQVIGGAAEAAERLCRACRHGAGQGVEDLDHPIPVDACLAGPREREEHALDGPIQRRLGLHVHRAGAQDARDQRGETRRRLAVGRVAAAVSRLVMQIEHALEQQLRLIALLRGVAPEEPLPTRGRSPPGAGGEGANRARRSVPSRRVPR